MIVTGEGEGEGEFQNPDRTVVDESGLQLAVESMLDPRSQEFANAIKLTPATLAHYRTKGRWQPAEHLLYIASILAHEITLGDARIIVEVPPRHGKSEEISVHTPIWFLEHFPWANVLLTTYAADLATGFGRRVRDAFLHDPGFLKTKIRDDVQRTDHFITTEGGGMGSVGIGGPITGRGAHLLLVDDYIKNWAEASSPLVLDAHWDWFATTAYTRLEPGGSCVVLATRWVVDDLIGRLKTNDTGDPKMWTVIRLPALAEADDPLNRQPGEALWPQRYPAEKLHQIRSVIGTFMFNAMYQQSPQRIADSKADVSMIEYVTQVPQLQQYRFVRSWDLAATGENERTAKGKVKKSDWTVGTLIGTNGRASSPFAKTAILDMVREKWKPKQMEDGIRKTAEADGVNIPIIIEQEPGSSGKSWAAHLKDNVLRGFRVEVKPPAGQNKWVRAQPYIAAVTHGRIIWQKAGWNDAAKRELEEFPSSPHDDTVDSCSQGFNHLHQTNLLTPTWGRDEETGNKMPVSNPLYSAAKKIISGVTWGKRN